MIQLIISNVRGLTLTVLLSFCKCNLNVTITELVGNLGYSVLRCHIPVFACFQAPRVEAQTILGSLVCFPNVYHQIPLLQHESGSDDVVVCNEDIKVRKLTFQLVAHLNCETCRSFRMI